MANIQQKMKGRLLYTGIIFLGHLAFGIVTGLSGPSLVDFQYLLHSSIEQISFNFTFVITGSILGCFFSFLYKWPLLSPYLNRQLLTSLLFCLLGLTTALTPQLSNLPLFYTLNLLAGLGCGNWNTVVSTWLMELWSGRRLASLLQMLQLCYGLGTILGPILLSPYLSGYAKEAVLTQEAVHQRRQLITFPYLFTGGLVTAVGLFILILYFTKYRYSAKSKQVLPLSGTEAKEPTSKLLDQPENHHLRPVFLVLMMLFFGFYNLCEINHLTFQNTYFQSLTSLNISASEAADISSLTATSYTVGRGLSILTASFLSSGVLIGSHLTLVLLSLLAFFWSSVAVTSTMMSINSVILGFAFSAITPATFSYVHTVLNVDDRQNGAFFASLLTPCVFTPFLLGPYLESFPIILLYTDVVSAGIAFALFVAIVGLLRKATHVK